MSKAYTQSVDSIQEATTKGAYMVYDHCEDETKTNHMEYKAGFAIVELSILLATTVLLIAYTII